jgi:nucleoside-diphosphate-sugar epimerase
MFWHGKSALVIGGSGFLGGWIARRLVDRGAKVSCIVRTERPYSQLFISPLNESVHVIRGDARDPGIISGKFDAIFHTASLVDVSAALKEPERAIHDSVETTLMALEYVRHNPETLFILSSSDKSYGPQPTPYREEMCLKPRHPYEVAKATQDHIARSYAVMYGLNIAITRCANFFGPYDFAFERIIPYTIQQLLKNEPPVLRSDGTAVRDFLYVEEAAHVHLMLAEHLAVDKSLRGEAFNFSHGVDLSMLQLTKAIGQLMRSDIAPQVLGVAKGEISIMQLNCTKAAEKLGWKAGDFKLRLSQTVEWYCANLARLGLI